MSDIYGVQDPQSVALRPLNKGMMTNVPTQAVPPGAGTLVENFIVTKSGLRIIDGWRPFSIDQTTGYGRLSLATDEYLVDIIPIFTGQSQKGILALTNKYLYQSTTLKDWDLVYWQPEYTTTVIAKPTATTAELTVSGRDFTADRVRTAMKVVVNGNKNDKLSIDVVTSTKITISGTAAQISAIGASPQTFRVLRDFTSVSPRIPQWTRAPGKIYIVDGSSNGVFQYDGTYMSELFVHKESPNQTVRTFEGAATIAYIAGRLVVGSTYETNGAQRLRWSTVTDISEFQDAEYVDFVSLNGQIIKITNFEEYPIVALDDGVYFGQSYALDALFEAPWMFRQVETGGASFVGPQAFVRIPQALIFAGKTDFYAISPLKRTEKGDFVAEPMKCPIVRNTLGRIPAANMSYVVASINTARNTIYWGLPTNNPRQFSEFAFFNIDTSAWSVGYSGVGPLTCMSDLSVSSSVSWQDWIDGNVAWEDLMGTAWGELFSGFSLTSFVAGAINGVVYIQELGFGVDQSPTGELSPQATTLFPGFTTYPASGQLTSSPHRAAFETGDIDMDQPDDNKVAFKCSVRVGGFEAARGADINVTIKGSVDKARTWKTLGRFTLNQLEDEDEQHFRLFGTNMRFRIEIESSETTFEVEEIVLRIRGSGQQVVRAGD